jgi:hypothetical protein
MKSLLLLFAFASILGGCASQHEIEADMVAATLVKVDVVNRSSGKEKILTWKTNKDITYITYEPDYVNIPLGTITHVLIQK